MYPSICSGLELDPENAQLKEAKEQVEAAMKQPKSPFSSPEFFGRLMSDPRTRAMMDKPDFMAFLQDLQSSPQNMMKYLNDPRMQLVSS